MAISTVLTVKMVSKILDRSKPDEPPMGKLLFKQGGTYAVESIPITLAIRGSGEKLRTNSQSGRVHSGLYFDSIAKELREL